MSNRPEPFNWCGYLSLAEELASRFGGEAALRSATSRAYYAVLEQAADQWRSERTTVSALQTHAHV